MTGIAGAGGCRHPTCLSDPIRSHKPARPQLDGALEILTTQEADHSRGLALAPHPPATAETSCPSLSLRGAEPLPAQLFVVHDTPLLRKSSAYEVSQSTVRREKAALQQDDGRDDALREDTQTGAEPTFQRTLTGPNATLALGESLF